MFSDLKSTMRGLIVVGALLILGGYALFEARGIIIGPTIEITGPKNGEGFDESLTTIEGHAKHVSFISLNDHPITVNESGYFREKLLLSPGYNIIKLKVVDRFGRERTSFLELLFKMRG
jgi:hypothetical protein